MNRKSTFLIVTALVAGAAATAQAQICAGTAPFSAGSIRVGAGAEFPDGAKMYGGELAWGHQSGAYLGGSLTRMTVDNTDLSALRFGANAGYELSTEAMPKLRFCPVASFGYSNGPDIAPTNVSVIDYAVGGAVGSMLSLSDAVSLVPSATLSWTGARAKAEQNGTSATASDSWAQARLAAGIVFNDQITVAPVVTIPFSDVGGDTRFGFTASYNFGRSSGVMQQGHARKKNSKR